MLNTVVRQIAFYEFERKIHIARREGELTSENINKLWMSVQAESLGPSIELKAGYEVFWAYIGYSQYMLIWYANLPIETSWFFPRQLGPWYWVSLIIIYGHFVLPFLLLVSRWPKRFRSSMALIAAWMMLLP